MGWEENGVSTPHVLPMVSYVHKQAKHSKNESLVKTLPFYTFRVLMQSYVIHVIQPNMLTILTSNTNPDILKL